jgi:hypothetical protein|tara:strand:+ start:414 stop:683 length:270 start_codon:yes stop_codon:yes gene_type:complete
MKKSYFKIFFLFLLGGWVIGCQPATHYQAYEDTKKKGEIVFIKDLQKCHILVNESTKLSEGSEGAGERMNRERFIFKNCMKKNDWILKS